MLPNANGGVLVVAVRCEEFGDHSFTVRPDWSIESPHDTDAERVALAFGDQPACGIVFVDYVVPTFRRYLEANARAVSRQLIVHSGPRPYEQGLWWAVADECTGCQRGYDSAVDAEDHFRSLNHHINVSRPNGGRLDYLGRRGHVQFLPRPTGDDPEVRVVLSDAEVITYDRAILKHLIARPGHRVFLDVTEEYDPDPDDALMRIVLGEGDPNLAPLDRWPMPAIGENATAARRSALRRLWKAGIHPSEVEKIADQLRAVRRPIPEKVFLLAAYAEEGPGRWIHHVIRQENRETLKAMAGWLARTDARVDAAQAIRWIDRGLHRELLALAICAGADLDVACDVVRTTSHASDEVVGWMAMWKLAGCAPTVAQVRSVARVGRLHVRPQQVAFGQLRRRVQRIDPTVGTTQVAIDRLVMGSDAAVLDRVARRRIREANPVGNGS